MIAAGALVIQADDKHCRAGVEAQRSERFQVTVKLHKRLSDPGAFALDWRLASAAARAKKPEISTGEFGPCR